MPTSSRQILTIALRVTEGGVAALRRDSGRLLTRAEMHVRAWREALDPTTRSWATRAREERPERSAAEIRADLARRIEDLHDHP